MRALTFPAILLCGIFLLAAGVPSTAQDKDKKMPNPNVDKNYTEKVTVRIFEAGIRPNGALVAEPVKDVRAFRYEKDGELWFCTKAHPVAVPNPKTEITDEKGNVYVVEKVVNNNDIGHNRSKVKPKAKDATPPRP
ncbi:hypothetical protein GobsT_71290 [Gemmata obscuriglobus]|uniref:Uncharacterized protein n=1 Tax=Gemmata obscuriglobus TaxID=114 RepID=A0A2Z3H7M6_9BACT|nr:hypothetical protein [Gemmata obscuriglobus]AWM41768.1 hypothetical protein C1280_35410 [Gemmata obscuriglobus]QEG32276.1 hypothetical protein GobsT_71290 [Gemmata obscuriglobus]VTS11632.1 unnamed protein product [Gemmata obscuriglobus UQM 2246]